MHHTYEFTTRDIPPPGWFRQPAFRATVSVVEPRCVTVDGITLRLLEGQPDLPVGDRLTVWLEGNFLGESEAYIEARRLAREQALKAQERHEAQVREQARDEVIRVQRRLEATPRPDALGAMLDSLYAKRAEAGRTYRMHWHSTDPVNKQASNDALIRLDAINTAIGKISEHVQHRFEALGVACRLAYAYSPREGASGLGRDHLQLMVAYRQGRLKRQPYDALCRPARQFWGLSSGSASTVSCTACLRRMLQALERGERA